MPADEAMQRLKDGNARYVSGKTTHDGPGATRREELARTGQRPIAAILGCSDSRAPIEIIFDQGVGDVFVIRVAGNIAGASELGSIEYAVGTLGTPVVLVLGHSACGAVSAALHNTSVPSNVAAIISQIRPAVTNARAWSPNASGADLVQKSVKANVWQSMESVLRKSREVRERVQDGRILLVGGVYELDSGQVAWLGQHPEQGKILAAIHAAQHKPKPRPKPEAAPKAQEQAEPADAAPPQEAASAASESPPAAGRANKAAPHNAAKPTAKPSAKTEAKSAAKSVAAAEPGGSHNPDARSEGEGELLAPMPEKAPAKAAGKAPAKAPGKPGG